MGLAQVRTAIVKAADLVMKASPFLFTDDQLIYENTPAPVTAGAWAQYMFAPRRPVVATLGGGGQDMVVGIFRVDVRLPLDTGVNIGLALTDAFRLALPAGTRLSFEGQEVTVLNIGAETGRVVDTWYRTDIAIAFRAYLPRGG